MISDPPDGSQTGFDAGLLAQPESTEIVTLGEIGIVSNQAVGYLHGFCNVSRLHQRECQGTPGRHRRRSLLHITTQQRDRLRNIARGFQATGFLQHSLERR